MPALSNGLAKLSTCISRVSLLASLRKRLAREPNVVLLTRDGRTYLRRWYLIPKNKWLNVYLHHFCEGDDDRAPHCHPWASVSILLKGRYWELIHEPGVGNTIVGRASWKPIYRPAAHAHRILLDPGQTCWTLFATGPKVRKWGFYCRSGWRAHEDFAEHGCE